MQAKEAVKDVGRAMGMPDADVDRIAELIPTVLNISLDQSLKDSPELAKAYESDSQIRELLDTARKLEGLVRNSGVHAAGGWVLPEALTELGPLCKNTKRQIFSAVRIEAE